MPEAVAPAIPEVDPAEEELQNKLWAAAEMVAEAASANTTPSLPAAPAPMPLAVLPPEPVPAPPPEPEAKAVTPFMTNLRQAPNSIQWAVFGGTAAFLGVIWVAIWFAVGK
jgi:hypothetical protein